MTTSDQQNRFPAGWDEARVRRFIDHYESQSEDEAVAEDEAAFRSEDETFMGIPKTLLPAVRELLARLQQQRR